MWLVTKARGVCHLDLIYSLGHVRRGRPQFKFGHEGENCGHRDTETEDYTDNTTGGASLAENVALFGAERFGDQKTSLWLEIGQFIIG